MSHKATAIMKTANNIIHFVKKKIHTYKGLM